MVHDLLVSLCHFEVPRGCVLLELLREFGALDDQATNLGYVHFQQTSNSEGTIQAKEAFEAYVRCDHPTRSRRQWTFCRTSIHDTCPFKGTNDLIVWCKCSSPEQSGRKTHS